MDEGGELLVTTLNALPASTPPSLTRPLSVTTPEYNLIVGPTNMQTNLVPVPTMNPSESDSISTTMQTLVLSYS